MVGTLPPLLVELRRTSRFAHPTDCELICFARKRNLARATATKQHDGQISQNIFRLTRWPNQPHNSACLTADEGRWPSSRTCGEMRWKRELRLTCVAQAYGQV